MEKLLEVKDLKVSFFTDLGETQAVKGAGFAIGEGDFFGIVGESGSGKSVTTKSILRLGPSNCKIMGGEILFRGEDILKKNEAELRGIRGGEIAMIFQDSLSALNPVYTVGNKMVELIRRHTNMNKKEAKARVLELLTAVGITDPEKAMSSYPHELSGGMRQRVMIAMAMSSDPKVLIADEPTTALDVTIQAQILHLLLELQKKNNMSIILITHDLGLQGNIQRRNGLIADYKFRLYGKCSCNGNPLTLSAGELMRILQKILLFEANHTDQFFCTLLAFFLRVHFMDCHRLTDDILHCMAWVQRRIGILKNGLHFFAIWKQFFFPNGSDLCSFIKNLTACGFMIT